MDRNLCFGSDTVTKSLDFTYVNFCLFICKQWTESLIVSGQALYKFQELSDRAICLGQTTSFITNVGSCYFCLQHGAATRVKF